MTHLLRKSERAHAVSLHRSQRLHPSPNTSRDFWRLMKELRGQVKSAVIPNLSDPRSSSIADSPSAKANLLNNLFSEQTHLRGSDLSTPDANSLNRNSHSFSSISTKPSEVYDVLLALRPDKSPGLDDIPSGLLKLCAQGIASSLSELFNRSFSQGRFPLEWKSALVVPVFKRGTRSDPGNYRPIALLPIVSKVMEKIVHNKLSNFLRPWLNNNQSGFKKRDGTVPQLIRLAQTWSEAIDESKYVGVVFFDLRKAFDRVWHEGLLEKLRAAGVSGSALLWFASFLSGRRQATLVDGCMSDFSLNNAGVPQGAILSPLLFSVYMNDIPSFPVETTADLAGASSTSTNLFADDTSLYSVNSSFDCLAIDLQHLVDVVADWFAKWLLEVNTSKSAVLIIRSRGMASKTITLDIKSSSIPQVQSQRHLGVVFNETLTWSDHTDMITKRASAKLGLLRRLRSRTSMLIVRDLYLHCIRPVLEYACEVWCGNSASDSKRLERLNRLAGRLILHLPADSNTAHDIILARAGLTTLLSRRKVQITLFAHRFLAYRQPCHLLTALSHWLPTCATTTATNDRTLRNSNNLRLPRPKKNCLKRSPLYLSFSTWNSLPDSLKSAPSKQTLSEFLQ